MSDEEKIQPLPCPCGSPPVYDAEPMPDFDDPGNTGEVVGVVVCCFSCGRGVEPKLTAAEAVADWNANRLTLKPLGT